MRLLYGLVPMRPFWFVVFPHLLYALGWYLVPAPIFIVALNVVTFAFAVGICSTFFVSFLKIIFSRRPIREMEPVDWFTIGVWLAWYAVIILRVHSTVWRYLGRPDYMENLWTISYAATAATWAGAFHLAGPGTIGTEARRIPTERWVRVGQVAAGSLILLFALTYAMNLFPVLQAGFR